MTLCPYCQAQNGNTAGHCVRCGRPLGTAPVRPPGARTLAAGPKNGLAIASLVLGILSMATVGCLGVGAVAAIVCGIIALSRIKNDPRTNGGRGLAVAGIVTGGLALVMLPIAAAIAIPALRAVRQGGTLTTERGIDRPGGDYRRFAVSGGAEQCRSACATDPVCKAYTWVRAGGPYGEAQCWLKSHIPGAVPNGDCVSGVKGE